jgi:hypothetical protein
LEIFEEQLYKLRINRAVCKLSCTEWNFLVY